MISSPDDHWGRSFPFFFLALLQVNHVLMLKLFYANNLEVREKLDIIEERGNRIEKV